MWKEVAFFTKSRELSPICLSHFIVEVIEQNVITSQNLGYRGIAGISQFCIENVAIYPRSVPKHLSSTRYTII